MSGIAARCGVVLAGFLGTFGVVAAACSPFGTADDGTSNEGGSGSEGGPTADGALAADGASPDAGTACDPAFCTGFDDGGWPKSWKVVGDATALTVKPGGTSAGGYALDAKFKDGIGFLAVDVTNAKKVVVEANVKVVMFSDGEVNFLGIAEAPATNVPGVYLVHPSTAGGQQSLYLEVPNAPNALLSAPFTAFTPVRLELDLVAQTYFYKVGAQATGGQLSQPIASSTLSVVIGGQYTSGASVAWEVQYDDITIAVTK